MKDNFFEQLPPDQKNIHEMFTTSQKTTSDLSLLYLWEQKIENKSTRNLST